MEAAVSNILVSLGLERGTPLERALSFFIYDSVKILVMLATIIFIMAVIRTYLPPERVRNLLNRRRGAGNFAAAGLGVFTPFCSCSAIPMYIGFMESGIPLGVALSFLIAAPLVNEVALAMLFGLFGLKVAALYLVTGLTIAITAGIIIGLLRLESQVEENFRISCRPAPAGSIGFPERIGYAAGYTSDMIRRIWYWILIGIALGAFLHGYTPDDFLAAHAGSSNPLAVPLAVAIGVPLYASCGGVIPVAYVLLQKGMALGTVLAFVMAVSALSFPEIIILRQVMKPKLLSLFVAIVSISIVGVGYLFNALF
ncbi:MAG TPA: permease [Geobacterales bacterium]|nr:permease [Geobacterales bacterium]